MTAGLCVFSITRSPCGKPIYEVMADAWEREGYPNPETGEDTNLSDCKIFVIDNDDPSNKYGFPYMMVSMPGGVAVRVLPYPPRKVN